MSGQSSDRLRATSRNGRDLSPSFQPERQWGESAERGAIRTLRRPRTPSRILRKNRASSATSTRQVRLAYAADWVFGRGDGTLGNKWQSPRDCAGDHKSAPTLLVLPSRAGMLRSARRHMLQLPCVRSSRNKVSGSRPRAVRHHQETKRGPPTNGRLLPGRRWP